MKTVSERAEGVWSMAGARSASRDVDGRPMPHGRLAREWRTMSAMVECYCRGIHGTEAGLCQECQALLAYANKRLDRCQFGPDKPTCARCPVHCYQADRRELVRAVMRYAGPRMLWLHPILSLRHWLDGLRSGHAIAVAAIRRPGKNPAE